MKKNYSRKFIYEKKNTAKKAIKKEVTYDR